MNKTVHRNSTEIEIKKWWDRGGKVKAISDLQINKKNSLKSAEQFRMSAITRARDLKHLLIFMD